MDLFSIILAGGSGTRLWPLSRGSSPKHLLPLNGEETLIQQTARRLLSSVPPEKIITVTHENHYLEIREQLSKIHPKLVEKILTEPCANNTLPAIAWAVAAIAEEDSSATIGVFPADHAIPNNAFWTEDFNHALEVAQQGYIVTFGVKPTAPEIGYGYIQTGAPLPSTPAFQVLSFTEKPNAEKAALYLKSGGYYWNTGMFIFRAEVFSKELLKWEPGIYENIKKIILSKNDVSLVKTAYSTIKKISIDHGIMEKADKVAMLPARFEWNDLGSWESIYQQMHKDDRKNATRGKILLSDVDRSLFISQNGLIAAIGMKDTIVIQTEDAVLVSPRDRVQKVKDIVEHLKSQGSHLGETHRTETRPWGTYTVLEENPGYKIKRIVVKPGQTLSLQSHQNRAEHWVVIEGTAKVTNGLKEILLKQNESTFIPKGEKHRLENPGDVPLTIIEVQTGTYLGEDDIQRFDDTYGRV